MFVNIKKAGRDEMAPHIVQSLTPHERIDTYGIDCDSQVVWEDWNVGREYTKILKLRNVSLSSQNVRVKLNSKDNPKVNEIFETQYHEPFKLSSGIAHEVKITYKPVKYEHQHAHIEIITKHGSFFVPLKALVRNVSVQVQQFMDFGLSPVLDTTTQKLTVTNTSLLPLKCSFDSAAPFSVEPQTVELPRGGKASVDVSFKPSSASVYDAAIILNASSAKDSDKIDDFDVSTGLTKSSGSTAPPAQNIPIRLTGVAKLPFLSASNNMLEFGGSLMGQKISQVVTLKNVSAVRAEFKIDNLGLQALQPQPFSITPRSGSIVPNATQDVEICYHSNTLGEDMTSQWSVVTPGGASTIAAHASCAPLDVTLSAPFVDFGEVSCGQIYRKCLKIHNHSNQLAPFNFVNASEWGVFGVNQTCGVIPPQAFVAVTLFFRPVLPINYYKRVYILVRGCSKPLVLDFLGSPHDNEDRPAHLTYHHIAYWRHMLNNNVRSFPDINAQANASVNLNLETANKLEQKLKSISEDLMETQHPLDDEQKQERLKQKIGSTTEQGEPMGTMPMVQLSTAQTYLECMAENGHTFDVRAEELHQVSASPQTLDFCSFGEKRTITLTNHGSQTITVDWLMPGETRLAADNEEKVFTITPSKVEIGAGRSYVFSVSLRSTPCAVLASEAFVEACTYVSRNRSWRMVDTERFVPPVHITLPIDLSNLLSGAAQPRVALSDNSIRFKSVGVSERSYHVLLLQNNGDNEVRWNFGQPADPHADLTNVESMPPTSPFSVFPAFGGVQPHSFAMVVLEFAPNLPKNEVPHFAEMPLILDGARSPFARVNMAGRSWKPIVNCGGHKATVAFAPTCAGIITPVEIDFTNQTEIPLRFECSVPKRFMSHFWVPGASAGHINPGGTEIVRCNFSPTEPVNYSAPLHCVASAYDDEDQEITGLMTSILPNNSEDVISKLRSSQHSFRMIGHGRQPVLRLNPGSIDLGVRRAFGEVHFSVAVTNTSSQMVYYQVYVQLVNGPVNSAAHLKPKKSYGNIAGRCSEHVIDFSFTPPKRGNFEYQVVVQPLTEGPRQGAAIVQQPGTPSQGNAGCPVAKGMGFSLPVVAQVELPQIRIADVRGEGSCNTPASTLWTQVQADPINDLFLGEITDPERKFHKALGIDEKRLLVSKLQTLPVNLGTSALGAPPLQVIFAVHNNGVVPATFSFLTPKSLDLDNAPLWAQSTTMDSEEEMHYRWVEENNIFSIEPSQATLPPGAHRHIKISYYNLNSGTHVFPVIFKVDHGRSMVLFLKAHSVAPDNGRLSVRQPVFKVQPTPIGMESGPRVALELVNSGSAHIHYVVKQDTIKQLRDANHDFDVLKCITDNGPLSAGDRTYVHFQFTPIEAKEYKCPINVEMYKDDQLMEALSFEIQAEGYHPLSNMIPDRAPCFPKDLPMQTFAPVPGYGAALSIEHVDFGILPARAQCTRLVVLVNYNQDFKLSYNWVQDGLFASGQDGDEMTISPQSGELMPGQHEIISCTFDASYGMVDIAGEVACHLSWEPVHTASNNRGQTSVHMSQLQDEEEYEKEISEQEAEEVIAQHRDWIHDLAFSKKDPIQPRHVSITKRLTVSYFRKLMSTAAGQKYLNENLHRGALLSSHLTPRTSQGHVVGPEGISTVPSGSLATHQQATDSKALIPPSTFPLYLRMTVRTAEKDAIQDESRFLITEEVPSGPMGIESDPKHAFDAAKGVLKGMVADVLNHPHTNEILDNAVSQAGPARPQFRDSPPPSPRDVVPNTDRQTADGRNAAAARAQPREYDARKIDVEEGGNWHSPLLCMFEQEKEMVFVPPSARSSSAQLTSEQAKVAAVSSVDRSRISSYKAASGRVLREVLKDLIDETINGSFDWSMNPRSPYAASPRSPRSASPLSPRSLA